MNLADLSSVLIVLLVTIGTPSAADAGGAPFWLVMIIILPAVALGLATAYLNGRLMYRLLGGGAPGQKKNEGNLFLYMVWPFISWVIALAAAICLGNFAALISK